jgi:hypothetical protein
MTDTAVVPIVKGHGEVQAFPTLLYRVRDLIAPKTTLKVYPPIRVKAGKFLNSEKELYRCIRLAGERAASVKGHVIILLDSEHDCPRELGPSVLEKAKGIRNDVSFVVALAYRERHGLLLPPAHFEVCLVCQRISYRQEMPSKFEVQRSGSRNFSQTVTTR